MEKVYNTKLTAEQKATLKVYKKELANTGVMVVFIGNNTIAMVPNGCGRYYIGKAVASKHEQKLRAKVGMLYALERAYKEECTISYGVLDQIIANAQYWADETRSFYDDESFEVTRYL